MSLSAASSLVSERLAVRSGTDGGACRRPSQSRPRVLRGLQARLLLSAASGSCLMSSAGVAGLVASTSITVGSSSVLRVSVNKPLDELRAPDWGAP